MSICQPNKDCASEFTCVAFPLSDSSDTDISSIFESTYQFIGIFLYSICFPALIHSVEYVLLLFNVMLSHFDLETLLLLNAFALAIR